jgi:hypothetical protein
VSYALIESASSSWFLRKVYWCSGPIIGLCLLLLPSSLFTLSGLLLLHYFLFLTRIQGHYLLYSYMDFAELEKRCVESIWYIGRVSLRNFDWFTFIPL